MANATTDIRLAFRGRVERIVMPIQASTKMYMGVSATRDSSGNIGVQTANERFMGFVTETIDNSNGATALAGRDVELYHRGSFLLTISGALAADEGKAVFCGADDQTHSYNPKAAQFIGNVEQFDSTGKAWVRVENPGSKNWNTWATLADDAELALPVAEEAIVTVIGGSNGGVFHVDTAGAVTKLSGTTNAVASDQDVKLCVYDAGTYASVKNRLGSSQTIAIAYHAI